MESSFLTLTGEKGSSIPLQSESQAGSYGDLNLGRSVLARGEPPPIPVPRQHPAELKQRRAREARLGCRPDRLGCPVWRHEQDGPRVSGKHRSSRE